MTCGCGFPSIRARPTRLPTASLADDRDCLAAREYVAFRCVASLLAALPAPAAAALCRGLAAAVCALPRKWTRGDVARQNLAVAFPELSPRAADERVRAMWTHLFRLVSEIVVFDRKLRRGNIADVLSFGTGTRPRGRSTAAGR